MPTINPVRESQELSQDICGKLISIGILTTLLFTALAFGTVEAWSILTFSLLAVVLLLVWGLKTFVDRQLMLSVPATTWPLLGLIAFGFLQGLARTDESGRRFAISMDVEATRLAVEVLVILFILFLAVASFFVGVERLAWFRNFLVLFGLGLAVFGLMQKFTWNGKYYWLIEPSTLPMTPFGPFVNRNHFAGYVEMIVPIPVALIMLRAIYGELSIFYGFAAVMMSVAIFISLSRGGMVSLAAGLIFVFAFGLKPMMERLRNHEKNSWKSVLVPRVGAAILIAFMVGFGVWWVGADSVINRLERTELSGEILGSNTNRESLYQSRGWIWRDTMTMIKANWLTGTGLGAFETAYPQYSQYDGSLIISQAHNDYLQIVADCGVVGGVLALWFVVLMFRDLARALQHRDEMMMGMALGCGGGVIAMLVHSLFDFNLQLPSNALLFLASTAVISNIGSAATSGKVGQALLSRA